ncbi:hypothetical protein ACFQ6S_03725 [Streptomyces sp. NPDC056479]|uniref:hypothetical protein n=1 Tax=Streptomyces sp. NPDC056479 TaxID=3345832 RepID=UPI00368DF39E
MPDEKEQHEEHPDTALEEVMKEITDAERRTTEAAEQRRRRGESGEAVTPDAHTQEESEGD